MTAAIGAADAVGAWETEPDAGPHEPPCLTWVAVFLVDPSWGGPQDGGWWFDAGELVTDPDIYARLGAYPAAFPTEDAAREQAERMARGLDALNEGRPPKHSVFGQGVYEVHALEALVLPRHWPETAPRYE